MEPRNIGLFLWHEGKIAARFMSSDAAKFVSDRRNYQDWVDYWMEMVSAGVILDKRGGDVDVSCEKCLDALLSTQDGNYLVVDSGFVAAKLHESQIETAADSLFRELVSPPGWGPATAHARKRALKSASRKVFKRLGVAQRSDFKTDHNIQCDTFGVKRHITCDIYIGNGTPKVLFQNADLAKEQSVNSSAMVLHSITSSRLLDKRWCRFLYRSSDLVNSQAEENLEMLNSICETIDIESARSTEAIPKLVGEIDR
ncbi:MAG: hypothetical protein WDZ51_17375 [Pirellulaceae bacterium]